MCGRYSMYEPMEVYLRELAPRQQVISYVDPQPAERYNIAPTQPAAVLRGTDAGLRIDAVKWGWAPFWAQGKRPAPINARVETVATGRFFKQLWPNGRVLVPANGWYEWVKDPANPKLKQPWFIRLKGDKPMFFAALAQVTPGLEPHDGDGFVIITDASNEGMVDIHDRRPVVLAPEQAQEWLESDLPGERSSQIAQFEGRPVSDFEWYKVGRAVGNVRNQGAELIEPVDEAS
ncbi:SOS response-associated peptidase [Pseudomonas sp. UBA4194]|uniref:SOS response-associated peptidase n=1 Tax=Pseudomonas sp. UBA4194 TaxID=1947317 RepID=UPI0025FAE7F2|nr:SOS response-associated peptidase family protein [Pseudomonas sp. UBA4194]